MRHRYDTRGIVLSRVPSGESSALVTILTTDLGLVRALAQGVRAEHAKLAPALVTLAESSLILVRGKEGWRVAGAVLEHNWFQDLLPEARVRAARFSGLLLRLVAGETRDSDLFTVVRAFLTALRDVRETEYEDLEILGALHLLSALGLSEGGGDLDLFSPRARVQVSTSRGAYIARINRGITASGL